MRKITLALATFLALTISSKAGKDFIPAQSEPIPVPVILAPLGLYFGGGLTYAHSECECDKSQIVSSNNIEANKYNNYGINLKFGYNFMEYLGVEAKYIYTPWGDDNTLKHYGIYLKPTYSINENLDIYALLGYGKVECDTNNISQKGFAWGAGAEYTLNKKVEGLKDGIGIYVEYLRPLKKTGNKDIKVDMVNAGINYNF